MQEIRENTRCSTHLLAVYVCVGMPIACVLNTYMPALRLTFTIVLAITVLAVTLCECYYVRPGSPHRRRVRLLLPMATAMIFAGLSWGSAYPFDLGTDRRLFPLGELLVGTATAAVVAYLFMVCGVVCAHLFFARVRRFRVGKDCLRCGYDLTGNVSGVCPECGHPVDQAGGE